jgi:iron complex transport system substrate-binding protein
MLHKNLNVSLHGIQMKKLLIFIVISLFLPGVAVAEPPKRIVSLAPNVTEILYDLGLGERVIAVSTYCNYPPEVKGKPKIGGMSNPSLEAIVALQPDMVALTDDGNPRIIAQRLAKLNIPTYVFRARRLADLPGEIRKLAFAFDVHDRGERSARRIEEVFRRYATPKKHSPIPARRKVLFIVQPEPLIVAGPGTAIDDVLKLLGLQNIAADAPNRYPRFSMEEVIRRSPDVIFIVKTHNNKNTGINQLLKRLNQMEAVRNGKVFYIGDPLVRMGPRITDGIAEIGACLGIGRN